MNVRSLRVRSALPSLIQSSASGSQEVCTEKSTELFALRGGRLIHVQPSARFDHCAISCVPAAVPSLMISRCREGCVSTPMKK